MNIIITIVCDTLDQAIEQAKTIVTGLETIKNVCVTPSDGEICNISEHWEINIKP